ncbi:MAG: carboxylesterase/lipase family protein [Nibricoccus sp.]
MIRPHHFFIGVLFALVASLGAVDSASASVTKPLPTELAQTTSGPIYGSVTTDAAQPIHIFKGIPYGADTAKRRFQPPLPPTPWTEPLDCLAFGPMAPQPAGARNSTTPSTSDSSRIESENCLRLNVWTPALRDGKKRPVLVYFHGGAYNGGSVNDDLYDGTRLCRRGDVVVVTVNHRLNGFGYLFLGDIGGPAYRDSGNAGQLDLILALKWVRDNIAEFGGDPGCVTIFGQSGGGAKCATLMAMPAARGLFHRVWTMSGQQITGRVRANANATARAFLEKLSLTPDRLDELNTLPLEKLREAMRGGTWTPVVDGSALPRDPFSPDASPLSADIPMVMGNTHDETRNLIGSSDPALFALTWDALPAQLTKHVAQFLGSLTPAEIISDYRRLYPDYSPTDVFFAATTAARSWKSMVVQTNARAAQPNASLWVYYLHWPSPVDGGKWRTPHTLDIPFVFDNLAQDRLTAPVASDIQSLADRMSDALIAFARTGNPQTPALPAWPKHDLHDRPAMIFDKTSHIENDPRGAERILFAPAPYIQPGT